MADSQDGERNAPASPSARGFTLVEAVIVMALIAYRCSLLRQGVKQPGRNAATEERQF